MRNVFLRGVGCWLHRKIEAKFTVQLPDIRSALNFAEVPTQETGSIGFSESGRFWSREWSPEGARLGL